MNKNIFNLSSEEKIQFIEDCYSREITNEEVSLLSELLKDKDKGVRNSVSFFFINSDHELVPFKVVEYVKSSDTSIRNMAGDILLKKGADSVTALLNFIDLGNADDKKFCIDILGLIGNQEACPKIISELEKSQNDNLTLACLEALGNLKCPEIEKIVAPIYNKNELFKPTIIEAFGKAGSDGVIQFLIDVFDEEDELIKYAIIESLGLIGKPETVNFLLGRIKSESYVLVGPVVNSIYQLVNKYNLECTSSDQVIEKIVAASDFIDQNHSMAAVSFLANHINEDVMFVFYKLFGKDFDVDMVIRQVFDNNLEPFLTLLSSYLAITNNNTMDLLNYFKEIIYVSPEIVRNVCESPNSRLTNSIVKLLSNKTDEIRAIAAEIILAIDPISGIENVDKLLNDQNVWNRMGYLENFASVLIPFPEEFVKIFLNDRDEMVKERALTLLKEHNLSLSGA